MKKVSVYLCVLLLALVSAAQAQVQRHALLDEAFTLLEKDNVFQQRYCAITGAEVESVFELGVPYFFGGQGKWLLDSWPDYRQFHPWQDSEDYKMDSLYLMGLDCSGFVSYVFQNAGYERPGTLSDILTRVEYRARHLFSHRTGMQVPSDPGKLCEVLRVGDLLIVAHPTWHVMMYIGTLADYGFTAEELPEAAAYLHYPLVIHSSGNPQLRAAFEKLILDTPLYGDCLPPVGGVAVSILGVPTSAARKLGNVGKNHYYGFELDGGRQHLYIWEPKEPEYYCWYRAPELVVEASNTIEKGI